MALSVNKAELARMFGVSEPTVGKWLVEGVPVAKGGSNGVAYEFDPDQVKAWRDARVERDRDLAAERDAEIRRKQAELFGEQRFMPEEISQEDVGRYLENQRLHGIVAKQRGEVIDRELVRNEFQAVFNVVRQGVLSWASTLSKTVGLTPEQQAVAERLGRDLLGQMHRQIRDPELRPDV